MNSSNQDKQATKQTQTSQLQWMSISRFPWVRFFLGTSAGIALGIFLYFYVSLGAFRAVHVELQERPSFTVLAREHFGAYHKVGAKLSEIESWAKSQGLDCVRTFGLYLDDPQVFDEARLRSHVGCLIAPNELRIAKGLQLPESWRIDTIPSSPSAWAKFEGAPSLGPLKVYGKVEEFLRSQNRQRASTSILEIYTVLGPEQVQTEFYFDLAPTSP